jgi:hypothetical protein
LPRIAYFHIARSYVTPNYMEYLVAGLKFDGLTNWP